jgi:3-hydroxyacyl-CoA dehydrogenase/enoyl-CoA hydratase/3-hydroxybutyryl-CoA epimerase
VRVRRHDLPIDKGLESSRSILQRWSRGRARNLIRTMFVNKGNADKLSVRPADVPKSQVRKLGVLGAGMMGAGIAYVSAQAGMEVVLIDRSIEEAEKGKAYSTKLLAKEVEKGRRKPEQAEAILARITPTVDYSLLDGADLVIEAVFENREIKADVTARAEAVIPATAVFAKQHIDAADHGSGQGVEATEAFIGIHFFSPVEKMPLVEIIVGRKSAKATLAHALDYVGQLRKSPIVVNDSRGFYTSRVFGTYCGEGQALLAEGVAPALIENAARMAGMPVGPLAVSDEVSLELQYKSAPDGGGPRAEVQGTGQLAGHPSLRRGLEASRTQSRRGLIRLPGRWQEEALGRIAQGICAAREPACLGRTEDSPALHPGARDGALS